MVQNPRTPARPDHIRPLNAPQPVTVIISHDQPVALMINRHSHRVDRIQDTWIIEDEWWRQPISRQYFALLLDDGSRRTVFHDRVSGGWHLQDY